MRDTTDHKCEHCVLKEEGRETDRCYMLITNGDLKEYLFC